MSTPLLQLRELSVSAGTTRLLDAIDLQLAPGECLGILGPSGSGKSLTALSLIDLLPRGLTRRYAQLAWRGQDLSATQLSALRGREIAYVFQDAASSLHPMRRVLDQLSETLQYHGLASARTAADAARAQLAALGLDQPHWQEAYPHQLSGGQRQRAMLALALAPQPALLLADEPTSALDPVLAARVRELLLGEVRRRGMALIFISHDLALLAASCDRLLVLEAGRIVEQGPAGAVWAAPQHPLTRRLKDAVVLDAAPGGEPAAAVDGAAPLLRAQRLRVQQPAGWSWRGRRWRNTLELDDFALGPGDSLGVVGASGSGKSTLARALLQLCAHQQGQLSWFGQRVDACGEAERRRLRPGLQMVFQDPGRSLDPMLSIGSMLEQALRLAPQALDADARRQRALQLLQAVDLGAEALPRYPAQFSGGQKQRLAIARALALSPRLLVCDEATSALDVLTQAQIVALLDRLRRSQGLTLVVIAHDLTVLARLCDQLLVLDQGRVVEQGRVQDCLRGARSAALRALIDARPLPERPAASAYSTVKPGEN